MKTQEQKKQAKDRRIKASIELFQRTKDDDVRLSLDRSGNIYRHVHENQFTTKKRRKSRRK